MGVTFARMAAVSVSAGFNSGASLFAQSYGDGRVKVYDTVTGKASQELVPTGHLRTAVSCVAWNNPKSKKLTKHSIAMGCDNGSVDIFSAATASCIVTLAPAAKAAATCAAFETSGDVLWVGYSNGLVAQFDLSDGSQTRKFQASSGPIKAIAVDAASGEWIATASTQLLLWSVEEDTQESRPLNAHPAGVSLLAGSPDGKYLLSGSQDGSDRNIALWKTSSSSKTALSSFALGSSPQQLSFGSSGDDLIFAAVDDDGSCSTWHFSAGSKPKKSSLSVLSPGVIGVSVGCDPARALVVLGSNTQPEFKAIELQDEEGAWRKGEIAIERKARSGLQSAGNQTANRSSGGVGSGHQDHQVLEASASAPVASSKSRKKRTSLGERAIGEQMRTEEVTAVPKADSSAVLLTQALHTEDSDLLEECLSCRDPVLVTNTVRRLPATSVVPFLQQVVTRLRNKPNRTKLLCHWVRSVLTEHTNYLTTVPAAAPIISEFYKAIDQRLTLMPHLLKLQGRLQLITSHIAKSSRSTGARRAPAVVFHETAHEDEEDDAQDEEDEEMDMDEDDLDSDMSNDDDGEDEQFDEDDEEDDL